MTTISWLPSQGCPSADLTAAHLPPPQEFHKAHLSGLQSQLFLHAPLLFFFPTLERVGVGVKVKDPIFMAFLARTMQPGDY